MDKIVDEFAASDLSGQPARGAAAGVVPPGRVRRRRAGHRAALGHELPLWINGGYFVLRQNVFDVLHEGEDLVGDAFPRLAEKAKLQAIPYHGFWAPMDTLKERSALEELHRSGKQPWAVWTQGEPPANGLTRPAQRSPDDRCW